MCTLHLFRNKGSRQQFDGQIILINFKLDSQLIFNWTNLINFRGIKQQKKFNRMFLFMKYQSRSELIGIMFRFVHVRSSRNSSSHNEVNLASVLVCIVIMFLLCHFPRQMFKIIQIGVQKIIQTCSQLCGVHPDKVHRQHQLLLSPSMVPLSLKVRLRNILINQLQYYHSFMHWLLIVNSSSNFIIYLFMGKKFKQVLQQKLERYLPKSLKNNPYKSVYHCLF